VSSNYESEMKEFQQNPEKFSACMPLDAYDMPTGSFRLVLCGSYNVLESHNMVACQ